MAQVPVKTVEFAGFPDAPTLRIDDREYRLGDDFDGRHGFDYSTPLGPRLLRIIVALAIARKRDSANDDGWRSAEELAVSADSLRPPDGTRSFIRSALRGYTPFSGREIELVGVPETHLVQYHPLSRRGDGVAHGRTRGPYRLGVRASSITLDIEAGVEFLGHCKIQLPMEGVTLAEAISNGQALGRGCEYLAARAILVAGLLRGGEVSREKERYALAADAYNLLGEYGMQLWLPEDAIASARRARALFKKLRHPLGVVSTLLTEAHAQGQLGREVESISAVRHARTILDDVTPRRRQGKRAECAGVAGQYGSRVHNFGGAERSLTRALELAQDQGDQRQICLWTVRRAENFLRQRDLAATERALWDAHDCYNRLAIGGMERSALWYISTSFAIATGRLDEAHRWVSHATAFAAAHGIDHQIARFQSLLAKIQ
jgi:tetratricopeptide (TPR) repeat protein